MRRALLPIAAALLGAGATAALLRPGPDSPLHRVKAESAPFPQSASAAPFSYPESRPVPGLEIVPDREVRNVLLFVGDGMGLSQIAAARILTLGPDGWLHLERMPVTGLLRTHSADDLVTDSAAAATALATGARTRNRQLGIAPDGTRLPTILEAARRAGLGTGLVTTSAIVDATPAGFAAHVPSRDQKDEIAGQLLDSGADVLIGAGRAHFLGSVRQDGRDLLAAARERGYTVAESREALLRASGPRLLAVFDSRDFFSSPGEPSLAEMTGQALRVLARKPRGFFLVVEQERTDERSHASDVRRMAQGLVRFDQALETGLRFAVRDGGTLVLALSDHETGGLLIDQSSRSAGTARFLWGSDAHTGEPVPLFAYGPHALRFTGVHDPTEIPKILASLLRLPFPR